MQRCSHSLPRIVYLISFCCTLCACASKNPNLPTAEKPALTKIVEPTSPFTLEIVEELNDGTNLHIHGRVQSAADWPAEDVVVRLSGMQSGEAKKVAFYPLNKLQQKSESPTLSRVAKGAPVDFYLSVPSAQLTDYQLELLWGREAKTILPASNTAAGNQAQGLLLQSLNVQRLIPNCSAPPCPSTYRLAGNLFNNSNQVVQQAELGVGFIWVPKGANLDLSAQIPQDEENVEISGLNLAPQQSRPFNLDIDRVVPEVPNGSFQPVVRVISASQQTAVTSR